MYKLFCKAVFLIILFFSSAIGFTQKTLAFPGAEGYGKYTIGGRGGAVYEVTNLNDAGEGSLRAAVEAAEPRTVVFKVSGTITLNSELKISHPYITIAGQTAPGDGICIRRYPIVIGASQVIIRYLRVRVGDESGDDSDAISGRYNKHIIVDHVSASWSIDETVSIYHCDSITVQWCLVSESMYNSNHVKGSHGFGGIWGSNYSTYHHNLLAHHSSRNPRFASGCGNTDFRNNVIYNWGHQSTYGGETQQVGNAKFNFSNINMVANYYKPGPATKPGEVSHRIASPWSRNEAADYGKWHISDNFMYGNATVTADNWNGGVQPQGGSSFIAGLKLNQPWPSMAINQQTAEEAYAAVLDHVGATLPKRDILDNRIVDEVRNGYATFEGAAYKKDHSVTDASKKSGIIDSQKDVGGWPELKSIPPPADTDHDGMPDDWEKKNGLNPNNAADRNNVAADGYTFLEKYLNSIALNTPTDKAPWEQHGKLEASPNGHTIQHKDGTPFLWIGDTGWGMFQQLTREEVNQYLDNRQKLGFTVIQSVAFWYPHGGGMKNGPHNAANAYGHRPFSGEETAPNTAEPLLVEGGSPDAPNDYWDHVDYVIEEVKKRNMYLALLPCWGRAYITPQMAGAQKEFTEEEARTYGAFLGERYQQEPHILWVLGGDAKAQIKGKDKYNNYQDWDMRSVIRAMAEGIAQGATGQQPSWDQAHPAWSEVFMTYHPDGDAADNSSKWFHEDAWLTANGVEVWREVDLVYPMMLSEYQLKNPIKPSLFLEGSYEFGSYRHECGWVTPVKVRRQIYHTFFAGGAGHTYGAGPIWAMRGTGGDYNCDYTWKQALAFPAGINFARVVKTFLIKHLWSEWIPDQKIVEGPAGEGESLKVAVALPSRQMALVYFSNNSQAKIKNTMDKAAIAHWFDPRNGKEEQADNFKQNEIRDLVPPKGWEDAILVMQARD
ncbi:MAG: hypothetical protein DHS20C18_29150 [Saprospiraceae bacterium]|nr:MAG: hypothetical protein DHS20C18_29150 [Saprospiraceae bacterium]